jgi:SAM-dependent methyltransferase
VKAFDRRYFDTWYRSAKRIRTDRDLARRAALAVAFAEFVLERPVRRILDIGCGEGEWWTALRRLRPQASYTGIDPSTYAVARFGRTRNVRLGTFGTLDDVADLGDFDLVVCADVLHYVPAEEISRGARALGQRLTGVALLQAYVRGDDLEGDLDQLVRRPATWYRQTFTRAGLVSLGLGFWTVPGPAAHLSPLELVRP